MKTNKETFEGVLEYESYSTIDNKMEIIFGNLYIIKYKKWRCS